MLEQWVVWSDGKRVGVSPGVKGLQQNQFGGGFWERKKGCTREGETKSSEVCDQIWSQIARYKIYSEETAWTALVEDDEMKKVLPAPPMVCYQRVQNLGEMLVQAKLPNQQEGMPGAIPGNEMIANNQIVQCVIT